MPDDYLYGESWELSCREGAMSRVMNGELVGNRFHELFAQYPVELLGKRSSESWLNAFPLLIKYLDASDSLSIQVHPDDAWALQKRTGESGKSEMWYVLDAEPNAKLMVGLEHGVNRVSLVNALATGQIRSQIHEVPIRQGDAVYIPAGTVHAILGGVRLAEIQQNSDTTYRLYDWNRIGLDGTPRPLHVNDALDVIDYTRGPITPTRGLLMDGSGWQCRLLVACSHFAVEEMRVEYLESRINPERFEIWMILKGRGRLSAASGGFDFREGETWMIPAALGDYTLKGNLHFLKTYIPDLEIEIIQTLRTRGCRTSDLHCVGGLERVEIE
jgi:mannose-6-phosphate isomerase